MLIRSMVTAAAFAALAPATLFAAGGDESSAPKPTTIKNCKNGQIWSDKQKACVDPQNSGLTDDLLFGAVREFAHAGQISHAQSALAAMSNQTDDRVLTYWGFTHRKMGNIALGMAYYDRALAANPDNVLARSYKGQAHVEQGDLKLARAELSEIRARGGAGTWAEASLMTAIRTGTTFNY